MRRELKADDGPEGSRPTAAVWVRSPSRPKGSGSARGRGEHGGLCLPASLVVMGVAAYVLLRDGSQARSSRQLTAAGYRTCRITHVLLPAAATARRADTTAVIGSALLASARGIGYRRMPPSSTG